MQRRLSIGNPKQPIDDVSRRHRATFSAPKHTECPVPASGLRLGNLASNAMWNLFSDQALSSAAPSLLQQILFMLLRFIQLRLSLPVLLSPPLVFCDFLHLGQLQCACFVWHSSRQLHEPIENFGFMLVSHVNDVLSPLEGIVCCTGRRSGCGIIEWRCIMYCKLRRTFLIIVTTDSHGHGRIMIFEAREIFAPHFASAKMAIVEFSGKIKMYCFDLWGQTCGPRAYSQFEELLSMVSPCFPWKVKSFGHTFCSVRSAGSGRERCRSYSF